MQLSRMAHPLHDCVACAQARTSAMARLGLLALLLAALAVQQVQSDGPITSAKFVVSARSDPHMHVIEAGLQCSDSFYSPCRQHLHEFLAHVLVLQHARNSSMSHAIPTCC